MATHSFLRSRKRLSATILSSLFLLGGCTAGSSGASKEDRPEFHSWVKIYNDPDQTLATAGASVGGSGGTQVRSVDSVSSALVTDGVRIGRGYDSAKENWLSNCVEEASLDTITGSNSQQVHYDVSIVKDLEEISRRYNVGVKVSIGLGDLFSGGGEFRLAQDAKMNQYSTHIVAKVQVEQQAKSMNKYLLKQWVLDSMKSDPTYVSSGKFAAKCGDGFASGFKTGGELIVLISRTNASAQEKLDIEASINAKVSTLFSAEANARAELMKTLGVDKTKFYVYSQGAVALLPDPENFLERAAKFPDEVAKSGGWPIAVRVTPYSLVENYPDLESPRNQQVARILKEMADYRTAVLPIHNDNLYIDINKAQFDLDEASHRESLVATREYLKIIEKAAIECYEEGRCEVPALPPLPKRPATTKTPAPTEYRAIWQLGKNECPLPGAINRCTVSGVAAECQEGETVCSRRSDGSWGWSVPCLPRNPMCLSSNTTRECVTGSHNCPGTQTFSQYGGWGQCMPKMPCVCTPGDTMPKTCANGATAYDTCGSDYQWSKPGVCLPIPEVCDGRDNDLNNETDELPQCHSVSLTFSRVDDDAYVWLNTTDGDNISKAICRVGRAGGTCDLSSIMAGRGNPLTAKFIIKFGNGGCFGSSGQVVLNIDGAEKHAKTILSGPIHCGFFYRQVVEIDFAHGKHNVTSERECALPTDCMY